MDLNTALLFVVIALLGLNQAAMRVPTLRDDDRVYWMVQFLDLAVATGLILYGLPGFEAFPAVPIVIGLLFVMHVAQNYNMRARARGADRQAEIAEVRREAEALRATRAPEEDF